jgi:hypothetical protein
MKRIVVSLLLLAGCSPYPYVPYEELDDAVAMAETDEEAEYYRGRIESWETQAEEASLWLDEWVGCEASKECWILCEYRGVTPPSRGSNPRDNRVDEGVEELVRWYRTTRPPSCGFSTERPGF